MKQLKRHLGIINSKELIKMKKTNSLKFLLVTFWVCAIAISGCDKETDEEGVITSPSAFFQRNLENAKQTFTIDPTIYNSLQGAQGTMFRISPNSFVDGQGNVVTGEVEVCLIEVYDRTTRVFLNKATMGVRSNGETDILKSGGQYTLRATQSGAEVFLGQPVLVYLPTANTGGDDSNMKKFVGNEDESGRIAWEIAADSVVTIDTVTTSEGDFFNAYSVFDDGDWQWVNCDYWYDYSGPKTNVNVQLPEGFNTSNASVVISIDGEPNILVQMYPGQNEQWIGSNIPVGIDCHFIAFTLIDDVLHYVIQDNTIDENHVEVINGWTPTTQSELTDLIEALP